MALFYGAVGLSGRAADFCAKEVVMRLCFPNSTRTKKAAKLLAEVTSQSLSRSQNAIARACGYRDWHELERSYACDASSTLDELLSRDEFIERQVALISRLSDELHQNHGDTQYALAASHLTGSRHPEPLEQLEIRVRLFRRAELPVAARRERGAIGKLKTPGRNGEAVILKRFGGLTTVISHKSADTGVADFEYVSPKQSLPLFVPMRLYLPYGAWTEADGATVLFSRDYCPLWRIREGRQPERLEPWQWIHWVDQTWFWDDGCTPWSYPGTFQKEIARLRNIGVVGLPLLVEVLPIVVHRDDVERFHDAVPILQHDRENKAAA